MSIQIAYFEYNILTDLQIYLFQMASLPSYTNILMLI